MHVRRALLLAVAALLAVTACSASTANPAARPGTTTPPPSTTPDPTAPDPTTPDPTAPDPATPAPTTPKPTPTTPAKPNPPPPLVVIDPGHNGGNAEHPEIINALVPAGHDRVKPCNTVGTTTDAGYAEHAFNWSVAQQVRNRLRANGIRVVLTRNGDDGVGPCVDERAKIGNRHHADAVVSIHGDGSYYGTGFHVIEAAGVQGGDRIDKASHRLAVDVHEHIHTAGLTPATYIGDGAGYDHRADLAGLNLSTRPSILVECGNMRDPTDAAWMSTVTGRARISAAITRGILAFVRE